MGFLSGRITYVRYRVGGTSPLPFGEEILEQAQLNTIGRRGGADPTDGVAVGWAGGDHVLDLSLDLGKNIINDAFHLAIRVDTDKIPGALLAGVHQDRDRRPGAAQPERLIRPRPSGRRPRRPPGSAPRPRPPTAGSAGWRISRCSGTAVSNVLYAGSTSTTVLERLQTLFRETFDRTLEPITAGSLAYAQAETRGQERSVEDFGPVGFLERATRYSTVAWSERRCVEPRLLGQRVPDLALAYPPGRRRHAGAARRLGSDRDAGQDADARLPAGRDRPRLLDQRGADPAPRGLPRSPGGQAPAQGGLDRGPARRAVRADAPGRDPGGLRGQPAQGEAASAATRRWSPGSTA